MTARLGAAPIDPDEAPEGQLGLERGFVVHGADGLDEITTTGTTFAFELPAEPLPDEAAEVLKEGLARYAGEADRKITRR